MAPVVAEVERVGELIARRELVRDHQRVVIEPPFLVAFVLVGKAHSTPIGQLEEMQMRCVPPGKREIDCLGELSETVLGADDEDPTRRRLAAK